MFYHIYTNKTFTLSGRIFQIYSLDGFNFKESISVPSEKGLYCFSNKMHIELLNNPNRFQNVHQLLYLGKADGRDGLVGRLTSNHEKFTSLQNIATYIGIYKCSNNENAKDIESQILSNYNFLLNEQENSFDFGASTVKED